MSASTSQRADLHHGLADEEVRQRRERYGRNTIEEKRKHPLLKFLSFFWGAIPWMIEIAAVLAAIARRWPELVIILVMLVVNATVGFFEEHKADRAIEVLKSRLALRAHVLRGGTWRDVAAAELVPGDVVEVRLGNIVPADVDLAGGGFLSVDQSALTGESLPVEKKAGDAA